MPVGEGSTSPVQRFLFSTQEIENNTIFTAITNKKHTLLAFVFKSTTNAIILKERKDGRKEGATITQWTAQQTDGQTQRIMFKKTHHYVWLQLGQPSLKDSN